MDDNYKEPESTYLIEWTEVGNKHYATLNDGSDIIISCGGKYAKTGMIALCRYGAGKIYPSTIENFSNIDSCKKYAELLNKKTP